MLLLVIHCAQIAAGANSWGCETYWSGPSASNSITDCLQNQNRQDNWTKWFWIPALSALTLALLLLVFPVVFTCRQCCNLCGGRTRQPGVCCSCRSEWDHRSRDEKDAAYSRKDHLRVKVPSFLVCIAAVGVLITIVRGASECQTAASLIREGVESKLIDTLASISTLAKTAVTQSSGGYVSPVTDATFEPIDSVVSTLKGNLKTYDNDYSTYITDTIRIGMNILGVVPFVCLLLLPLYASRDRCLRFWPSASSVFYFLLGMVFAALGLIFLFSAVALATGCGELERQTQRSPGIFQWYVKPWCTAQHQFDSLDTSLSSAADQYAVDFCTAASSYCDSSTTYISGSSVRYVCSFTSASASTLCATYDLATSQLNQMSVKSGASTCSGSDCSFSVCASSCTDSTFRANVASAYEKYTNSQKISSSHTIISPVLDCNYLADLGVSTVFGACPSLRNGFWMLGFGSWVGSLLFIVGIVLMMRGQKVFYKQKAPTAAATESKEVHAPDAQPSPLPQE